MKKRGQESAYYPIFLNISGKKCVVVGGGRVALRKVESLVEHGASVEVISPDFDAELLQLAESGKIHVLNREYRKGDLKDTLVAIAATDSSQTNKQIVKEARRRRILVNVVDDAQNSDFIVPSYLRRGEVAIAISTSGRSPALARKIRTRLAKDFVDEYADLALVVDEVRTEMKRQGIKVDGNTWQEVLDIDLIIDLLKKGDNEKAKAILVSHLQEMVKQAR